MKKVTKILTSVSLAIASLIMNPVVALAQVSSETQLPTIYLKPEGLSTITEKLSISSLVAGGIKLVLVIAALLFFFMLVIGGIQWIISGGDKAGSENARKRITSALVGLTIVFAAWAIATLIKSFFGIDIFTLTLPTFYKPS